MTNNKKLAGEWFDKAGEDELSARSILGSRAGSPSTVCFLSQQMSEKYLKGFLVYKGEKFPKIHQLDRLVKLCGDIDKDFVKIKGAAEFLSVFYITARYPGDYPQFSFKDARAAFDNAQRIKNFIINLISSPK